jgi:hypothetical protein
MPTDFHDLFATLEARKLRYVVVGGLALVLRGVDRLTADIDLAVDLATRTRHAGLQSVGHDR